MIHVPKFSNNLNFLKRLSFQIYVDGEQRQKVRSSSRTKALLHNINLEESLNISLHSTNAADEISEDIRAVYTPDMELVTGAKKHASHGVNSVNSDHYNSVSHTNSSDDNFKGAHL